IGLHQQFAILAAPHSIDENDVLHRIPIVPIVRRELIMPFAPAGIRIERDHRVREEIVTIAAHGTINLSAWISDGPIECVQIGVIRTRKPRRSRAVFPTVAGPRIAAELAWLRNGIPAPHLLSGCGIVGIEKAARAEFTAGHADDDFVFNDEWSA